MLVNFGEIGAVDYAAESEAKPSILEGGPEHLPQGVCLHVLWRPGQSHGPNEGHIGDRGAVRRNSHRSIRRFRVPGRAHLSGEIDRCLPWIREQDFDQLNVDLIAGMVGETWESWRETVQKTIDVDPDSVTTYQMELPYNTVYSQGILEGGGSPVADWQTKRAWNLHAIEELEKAGYEVSSAYTMIKRRGDGTTSHLSPSGETSARFAYRDSLWHGADMLGTGVASFGHLSGVHAQNTSSWKQYLDRLAAGELPLARAFETTSSERLTREFILQMKLGELDLGYFRRKFDVDPLEAWPDAFSRLSERRMLEIADRDRVRLTTRGLLQVDALLPEFYDPKYADARYT